ncbi:hypothetical protein AVEN_141588-1 [Araneus ventricosus]|uniref:Uncharacterized protein n=1 Tax=Araneus ventricosus TaxID=182803 RepID=A0A4Y2QXN2_ARAVE|nr:hypothetical protein AVEN_141588-1 [Araneus ventricosus]
MFPLCRCRAENLNQSPCEHSDEERSMIRTWVTEELKVGVQNEYRVTKIFEVYHFREKSSRLFKSYIDLFLKIKQENSGYPSDCTTDEKKTAYIQQYYEKEGVQLNPAEIQKKKKKIREATSCEIGIEWWGMNIYKSQLTCVNSLPSFNNLIAVPTKNIKDVYLPTPEVVAIVWDSKKDFIPQDTGTNIFLAAFTTAWAGLKLIRNGQAGGSCSVS